MKNRSQQNILSLGISLLLVFGLFFMLSMSGLSLKFELRKVNFPFFGTTSSDKVSLLLIDNLEGDPDSTPRQSLWPVSGAVSDTAISASDTMYSIRIPHTSVPNAIDTSLRYASHDSLVNERILLIGDSQLEGLRGPVYNYCVENHHQLVSTILWYGSSTKQWGITDTLDYFIKKFKPTMVLVALGLNELFVNDLSNRQKYISNILNKFNSYKVDYFWIGPAAWTKDRGIIDVMKNQIGRNFYPSHLLNLARASDRRHPSRMAAKIWFDSVANYVTRSKKIDFSRRTTLPPKKIDSPLIILQVPR